MATDTKTERIPPYTSYKTFRTLIDDLRTHGVPSHIDRDVLKRFSGSVGTQLMTALRFLKLISDANAPEPALESLVEAKELEQWKKALATTLKAAYGDIMALDLKRATPMALSKEFKERYTGKDDVVKKCVRFFVHAVKDAGIELSPRIANATRERRRATPNKPKKARVTTDENDENNGGNGGGDTSKSQKSNYEVLISILSPDMDEKEQEAVWTLIRYLKKAETDQ